MMLKPTESSAQELADRIHEYMIANDEAYAASVWAGQTLQWAIPAKDEETGMWSVPVEPRCIGALTEDEKNEAGFATADPVA